MGVVAAQDSEVTSENIISKWIGSVPSVPSASYSYTVRWKFAFGNSLPMTEDWFWSFPIGSNKRPTRSQLLVHIESVSHPSAADDPIISDDPASPTWTKRWLNQHGIKAKVPKCNNLALWTYTAKTYVWSKIFTYIGTARLPNKFAPSSFMKVYVPMTSGPTVSNLL